jgi:hypothetical protein
MSVLKVASVAINLAQQAARSDAAAREPLLQSCLNDLLVQLRLWRTESGFLVHSQAAPDQRRPAADENDDAEPTAIVGD